MISLLPFLGAFTSGEAAPEPEVVAEIETIAQSFAVDHSPIHLLPHERRQLRRINYLAHRDRKTALAALRLFAARARRARQEMVRGLAV